MRSFTVELQLPPWWNGKQNEQSFNPIEEYWFEMGDEWSAENLRETTDPYSG